MIRRSMPWYFGWNIIAVGLVFQAILFGSIFFSYTLWVGEWLNDPDLGVNHGNVQIPFMLLTVVQGALAPFAGRAMDHGPIRTWICLGAVLCALGFCAVSFATAFWQIAAIYSVLIAIGVLLAGPLAAQTLAARWFRRNRGLAIGLSTTGTSIGGMLMAPVVTALFEAQGWRNAHLILAAIFIVVIIPLVWTVVRNSPEDRNLEPEPDTHGNQPAQRHVYPAWTTRAILSERTFWVLVLAFTPMVTVFSGIQQNLRPYASDIGIDSKDTALLVSVFAGVMLGSKIFFGAMADRWDPRLLFWIAAAVLMATNALMMIHPDYLVMVLISAMLGFSAGAFLPLLGSVVGRHFGPAAFGRALGLIGPFTTLSAIGPYIAGAVRAETGSYDPALASFIAVMIPAVIVMAFLKHGPEHTRVQPTAAAGE